MKISNVVKVYLTIFLSFLLMPLFVFAAFDDVTLTTDTVLTVNGTNLNVSGSSAEIESIIVNASNFTVTLQPGSSLVLTSSDSKAFSVNISSPSVAIACNESSSSISITSVVASDLTILVTVSSNACTYTAPVVGGGGGIFTTRLPDLPEPRPQIIYPDGTIVYLDEDVEATEAIVKEEEVKPAVTGVSAVFSKTLRRGASNADVKRLQELLATDSDLYPEGLTTGYFGGLTEAAIQRFQVKYGVVSSGTPGTTGYGLVGPKTRIKLQEIFGSVTVPAESVAKPAQQAISVSPVFNSGLYKGLSSSDIKRLQQILNKDSETQVALTGPGSPGQETEYFGGLTEKAVQKFQEKHGVAIVGDPGYGYVGPKTRAKLQEIFK